MSHSLTQWKHCPLGIVTRLLRFHRAIQLFRRYVRELLGCLACNSVVDQAEVDGMDRYWLESYRTDALLGVGDICLAESTVLFTSALAGFERVERCFPVTGPLGKLRWDKIILFYTNDIIKLSL